MKTRLKWLAPVLALLLCGYLTAPTSALDSGSAMMRMHANGVEFKVYTYRPAKCEDVSILFVFHGLKRKAKSVRKKAKTIAKQACLMVFAPLFDKDRFPNWRYHRAGVVRKNKLQPRSQWTMPLVQELLDQARVFVNNPSAKMYLFGHSAGAQFLSRLTAYSPLQNVDRIVIANPSVQVWPSTDEAAPNGFGGVVSSKNEKERLKAYLNQPVTIYLGQEDTGSKYLVTNAAAKRQGRNRLARGRNQFEAGRKLARKHGWSFAWKLVEVPQVGHSSGGMLRAPALLAALGLPSGQ